MKKNMYEASKLKFPMNLQFFAEPGDPPDEPDEPNEPDEPDDGKGKNVLTMTQAELSAKMAQEKKQGRLSILKGLGIDTDDAKTNKQIMEKFKKWSDGQKSELELAKEKAGKAEAAIKRAEMAERKLQVIADGIKATYVEDFLTIASSKVTEEKDFSDVMEEMKKDKKYKSFFSGTIIDDDDDNNDDDDDDDNPGSKGTGNASKGKKRKEKNSKYGTRLAEMSKNPNASKSSYFSK